VAENKVIDSIKVTWPASGNTSVLKNVKANQIIEINESNSLPAGLPLAVSNKTDLMFIRCDSVLNYKHLQTDFADFFLDQNIIPHKFSQIGPRMTKGDLNKDGLEDIIIGSTNKIPTTVFIRRVKGFEKSEIEGLSTLKEFSESDLAIFDIDGDGDNDVVAVAGGYENPKQTDYRHLLYENNNGIFKEIPLPVPAFPASVIKPFDFDHDGDTDFFIGSRIKKGMFPHADPSWLIINEKGMLKADSSSKFNLGMVTEAVWSDYDKDGWEDLVIAREWNSMIVLKNMNGKELIPQNIKEFEDHHGIWYSVAAGDFDGDGDDDYIAGNLGENHRFTIANKYPLSLYSIDLDLDGVIEPLSTAYWKDQNDA
jgi:hypothetical protein